MRATFTFGYLQICSAHFRHYRISSKKSARGLSRKTVKMNSGPYPWHLCLLVHDLSLLETIMHASAHHKIHSFTKLHPLAKAARPLECNVHLLIRISSSSSWSRAQLTAPTPPGFLPALEKYSRASSPKKLSHYKCDPAFSSFCDDEAPNTQMKSIWI